MARENDLAMMFEYLVDAKANARYLRTRGTPSEYGYGNAFKVQCRRCKSDVFKSDYGNATGSRYAAIYAKQATEDHFEICIRG